MLEVLVHQKQAWTKKTINMSWIHFDDCIVLHPFRFACSPYWSLRDGSSGPIVGWTKRITRPIGNRRVGEVDDNPPRLVFKLKLTTDMITYICFCLASCSWSCDVFWGESCLFCKRGYQLDASGLINQLDMCCLDFCLVCILWDFQIKPGLLGQHHPLPHFQDQLLL